MEEEDGEESAEGSDDAATVEGDAIKIGALAPLSALGTVVGGEAMVDAMRSAEEGGIFGTSGCVDH